MNKQEPEMLAFARRRQQLGLEALKRAQEMLTEQMQYSDSDWVAGENRVKGDIHGTVDALERRIIPQLQSALHNYSAACWANNEFQDQRDRTEA